MLKNKHFIFQNSSFSDIIYKKIVELNSKSTSFKDKCYRENIYSLENIQVKIEIEKKIENKINTATIYPYEIANPEFLEDCEVLCVKTPGIAKDKIVVEKK